MPKHEPHASALLKQRAGGRCCVGVCLPELRFEALVFVAIALKSGVRGLVVGRGLVHRLGNTERATRERPFDENAVAEDGRCIDRRAARISTGAARVRHPPAAALQAQRLLGSISKRRLAPPLWSLRQGRCCGRTPSRARPTRKVAVDLDKLRGGHVGVCLADLLRVCARGRIAAIRTIALRRVPSHTNAPARTHTHAHAA